MTIQYTESDKYYFVRKPHGIPTTFGSQFSFVEKIVAWNPPFFASLTQHFSAEEEYWLLNRLDNDTAGFLYFAKTKSIKEEYKRLQDEQKINKMYIANLQGRVDIERTAEKHEELGTTNYEVWEKNSVFEFWVEHIEWEYVTNVKEFLAEKWEKKWLVVTYPIMHHIHDDIRMVAIRIPKDFNKWRGEKHLVETTIFPIKYNEDDNTTLCAVLIHQWIRHQIRVHCDSIWYPIVKDRLYGKRDWGGDLQLWSIGIV